MLGRLGIWVERLDKCGTWERAVEQACKSGISWLVIKAGDAYRNNQFNKSNAVKYIDYAHRSGLQVLSWHNSRPNMWTAEVHLVDSLFKDGVDGHIIVPSYSWLGNDREASKFMSSLRRKTKGFIAYSMPVNQASALPIECFGKELDAFMPVLKGELKGSIDQMSKVSADLSKRSPEAVKPIYPVISTRGPQELTKAMIAFGGMPLSLSSWEESSKDDVFVFPLLQKLNEKGLITLETEPVTKNEIPENNSNDE